METYEKTRRGAPAGFFAAEAAGLAWLAEPGVIPVVRVLEERRDGLVLEHLAPSSPGPEEARELGRSLAALHDAGAPGFGWTPADTAWFGPLDNPFPVEATPREAFAPYWAGDRLRPLLDRARPPSTPRPPVSSRRRSMRSRAAPSTASRAAPPSRRRGCTGTCGRGTCCGRTPVGC